MATQVTLNDGSIDSAGSLALKTNGTTTAVTINTSQNVGVGVTPSAWDATGKAIENPAGALYGYSTSQQLLTQNTFFDGAWKYKTTAQASYYQQSSGTHIWHTAASGTAGNAITFAERMRIDSSGNVGIGTSSPAYKLDVAGFSKGAIVHRSGSYTNGATTPSVSGATYFVISNSSPTTITNFTNAEDGQIIYLYFGNSNTTIDRTNCYLAGGVNFVSTAADVLVLLKSGSYWFEVSRSLNS